MLIERERELEEVNRLIRAAAAGRGGLLLIEGAAGIGKTSLLSEAVRLAAEEGMAVRRAAGGEIERELPFGIARDLLRTDLDRAATGRAGVAAAALRAAPSRSAPDLPAVLEGMWWLVRDLSDECPLLLAVDDLQWADTESLKLLAYLARRADDMAVALVMALRSGAGSAGGKLLSAISSIDGCVRVRPRALSLDAAAVLIRAIADVDAGEEECAELHRASAGNPLYLRALARAHDRSGDPAAGLEIVKRSVFSRLEGDPPTALELARAVAVLGTEVELEEAARLAGVPLDAAASLAHRLFELELLNDGERLGFVHPVVREALYEELGPARRGVAHLAAARMLKDAEAPAERVAAQLLRAPRVGEAWAVAALREAAGEATARAAHGTAAAYLSRAAEEAGADDRVSVLRELSAAEYRAGSLDAISHLGLAMDSLAGEDRVAAALQLCAYLVAAERERDALATIDQALPHASPAQRPRLTAFAAAIALTGVPEEAEARSAQLERVAASSDAVAPPVSTALAVCRFARNDRSLIDALEREMLDVIDGRVATLELWFYASWALLACEREATVIEFALQLREKSVARGSVTGLAMASSSAAAGYMRLGDLPAAEEYGHSALEAAARDASRQYVQLACGATLAVLTEQEASAEEVEPVLGLVDEGTQTLPHALPLWARARLRLSLGDDDGAIADLRRCGARCVPAGILDPGWVPWRSDLALALARRAPGAEEARALVDDELRLATSVGGRRAEGLALRALGLLLGGDEGIERLRAATELLAGTPARLEHARAQIDLGAALRRRRERRLAREPLSEALDTCLRIGARRLATRAGEELAASGARPRNAYRHGAESLTVSERRVARMAASGRTNREIAEELYVTTKTVETQLSSVYAKLGISGRPELERALAGADR